MRFSSKHTGVAIILFYFGFFNVAQATKLILPTTNGRDCTKIGLWDNSTKTCTLTQDVFETIEVSSGITLDGNGYTVSGAGSGFGIKVQLKTNVTVKNLTISGFFQGINIVQTSNSNFSNNVLKNNVQAGINLSSSQNITLTNNQLIDNPFFVSGNTIAQYTHSIDTSNIINDKPILYLMNANNEEFDGISANTFYCITCSDVIFENSVFDAKGAHVFLFNTNSTTIKNIELQSSTSFIQLESSIQNNIEGNIVNRFNNSSILLNFSSENRIADNTANGSEPIALFQSSNNNIIENNTTSGSSSGIYISGSNNNVVRFNESHSGGYGVSLNNGSIANSIHDNIFRNNTNGIGLFYGSAGGNSVYNNNFIDNLNALSNDGTSTQILNQPLPVGGNYWSQFDEDSEGCNDLNKDRICDTPLNFGDGGNNIDNFSWTTQDGWKGRAPCTIDCFSNVLFLPGLEASRLYKERVDGSEDQLWEPNRNLDVETLYLNPDGTSKNSDIYTRDIVKETNSPLPMGFAGQNIYKTFANTMDQLVAEEKINSWKAYAYDWRQDVQDIVNNGTKYEGEIVSLVDTLQTLVDSSKSGKVTIVAHSNGGLLAKALLKKLQDDKNAGINNLSDSVDVLILVAVPEIGTAQAVPAVLHGYDQKILGGLLMDKVRARELGRNMKSAYGLLPSREYVNHVNASPATFTDTAIPSGITTDMVQAFGSTISSYTEYKDFLFGNEGRTNPAINQINLPIVLSTNLFAQAETLHDTIDSFTPSESLRVIEIAGWGLDTVASFGYYPKLDCAGLDCKYILDQKPLFTHDGDKTVVVPSAHYMNFLGSAEKYWVDLPTNNRDLRRLRRNREHKDILEVDSLNNLIELVIEGKDIVIDTVLKNSQPIDTSNRMRLSIHSPVMIDAYDAEGNHTGKICSPDIEFCYVEENILNSSYLEFGEGKYINLPEDQMKAIKLQGTGIGTFTYESETVSPDGTSTTSSFMDILVTSETQAEITLDSDTQEIQLALDVNGDDVSDFTLTPSDTFEPVTYLEIMKATVNYLDLPQAKKIVFSNRIDNIIKSIEKGKIDQAKLKADKFKFNFENTLSKKDSKTPKPHKVSKEDAELLLDMLNKLLDNIN